jgi:hypothetical protein
MNKVLTPEEMLTRWEEQREVQNLMGRLTFDICLNRDALIFDRYWAKNHEVTLGLNNGYYVGAKSIAAYYEARHQATIVRTDIIKARFPEKFQEYTDEETYGAGQLEIKPLTSAYVKIAGDGETAKGMWFSQGNLANIYETGPQSFWTFGCFAVDFVKEGDDWKIWHMLYLEDLSTYMGEDWNEHDEKKVIAGFEKAAELKLPEPDVKQVNRENYSGKREFTQLPGIPEDYETFAETFSYGV